jgi:hypothetical protein
VHAQKKCVKLKIIGDAGAGLWHILLVGRNNNKNQKMKITTASTTNTVLVEDAAARKAVAASRAVDECKKQIALGGILSEIAAEELPSLREAERAAQADYRKMMQGKRYNTVLEVWE